jgi:hypothetical protein
MIIFNSFWIPHKVPSLNELNEFRAIQGPPRGKSIINLGGKQSKKKGGYRFNLYNQTKQKWSKIVKDIVTKQGFQKIESCYFNYLVVEKTVKRDPSNICASAIKFIEDGLMSAGVIPNDGWNNVIGINPQWVLHRTGDNGVMVFMTDKYVELKALKHLYMDQLFPGVFWRSCKREIENV